MKLKLIHIDNLQVDGYVLYSKEPAPTFENNYRKGK